MYFDFLYYLYFNLFGIKHKYILLVHLLSYLPNYLPTYLPTYLLTYLLTWAHIFISSCHGRWRYVPNTKLPKLWMNEIIKKLIYISHLCYSGVTVKCKWRASTVLKKKDHPILKLRFWCNHYLSIERAVIKLFWNIIGRRNP